MTSLYTLESTTWTRWWSCEKKSPIQHCRRRRAVGRWTHPAPVELVQPAVNPLLHIQPPLQLFAVVFDGDPRLPPLEALTRRLRTAAHLVNPPADPMCCHPDLILREKMQRESQAVDGSDRLLDRPTPPSPQKIYQNQFESYSQILSLDQNWSFSPNIFNCFSFK